MDSVRTSNEENAQNTMRINTTHLHPPHSPELQHHHHHHHQQQQQQQQQSSEWSDASDDDGPSTTFSPPPRSASYPLPGSSSQSSTPGSSGTPGSPVPRGSVSRRFDVFDLPSAFDATNAGRQPTATFTGKLSRHVTG